LESEIKGDNWTNWIHPDEKDDVFEEWQRCVNNMLNFDMNYRFVLPNGKIQKVHGIAYQLRDDSGNLIGFLGTLHAIADPI
jgi:PAS domain-containing protein